MAKARGPHTPTTYWNDLGEMERQRNGLLNALKAIHKGLDPNVGGPTITCEEILAIASVAIAEVTGGKQ